MRDLEEYQRYLEDITKLAKKFIGRPFPDEDLVEYWSYRDGIITIYYQSWDDEGETYEIDGKDALLSELLEWGDEYGK